jgi:hypothetical protein
MRAGHRVTLREAGLALQRRPTREGAWGREADDLLVTLADFPKSRSVSVHDRCKAVYEGLAERCRRS